MCPIQREPNILKSRRDVQNDFHLKLQIKHLVRYLDNTRQNYQFSIRPRAIDFRSPERRYHAARVTC